MAVTDGDTIKVMPIAQPFANIEKLKTPVIVRLSEIDSPEKKQAYGKAAKRFTADLVAGRVVRVFTTGKDRWGRIIGEVFLDDGRSLNRELIKAGLAWWYRKYSDDKSLGMLEAEARALSAGLWKDHDPMPPWVFRKRK